jgi:hypothetical protein
MSLAILHTNSMRLVKTCVLHKNTISQLHITIFRLKNSYVFLTFATNCNIRSVSS